MYLPIWPGLSPAYWVRPASAAPPPFPLNAPHVRTAYVARTLIHHLFKNLRLPEGSTVLVPDYHHGNEIKAIRAAGVSLKFYPVRRNFEADLDAVRTLCRTTDARALFVIHYLGWPQPIKELVSLCRERDMLLIEDCALALLSETGGQPLGSFGDHAVFCLYKTLPLPNGGLLVQNRRPLPEIEKLQMTPVSSLSIAGRLLELTLEWTRSRSDVVGKTLFALKRAAGRALSAASVKREPVGDMGFDLTKVHLGMSPVCEDLITRFDYPAIPRRRRDNYLRLCERLRDRITLLKPELEPGICPLFFPLLVSDKHAAAVELRRRGVDNVEFWNEGDPEARSDASAAQFLRTHLLELPVHQDLTARQVDYMADQILATKVALPSKGWMAP